jgi:hypothetical protein
MYIGSATSDGAAYTGASTGSTASGAYLVTGATPRWDVQKVGKR